MPVATATNLKGTPIAVNGSLFVTDGWGVVSKVDGASGELIWRYNPEPDHSAVRGACLYVLNRGPTSSDGKVFAAAFDGQVFALDMESGEEIWKVDTIDSEGLYTSSGAPRMRRQCSIGNAGAEFGCQRLCVGLQQGHGRTGLALLYGTRGPGRRV